MRFHDFFNLGRGPEAIVRLAIYPLVLVVAGEAVAEVLNRLPPADFLLLLVFLACVSPIAYLIREARRRRPQRQRTRRGAERTPLLPNHEEDL